jgi:hypothetical protein
MRVLPIYLVVHSVVFLLNMAMLLKIQPRLYFHEGQLCQYRESLIPLLKNWGIFRIVVRAQVVHRVVFTAIFFVR